MRKRFRKSKEVKVPGKKEKTNDQKTTKSTTNAKKNKNYLKITKKAKKDKIANENKNCPKSRKQQKR